MARRRTELDFPSVKIEGALFPGDFLARIAHFGAPEQSESDYRIPKKLRLRDELGRYFRIAEGLWQDFQSAPVGKGRDARKITVEGFLLPFLRQVLGFDDVVPVGTMEHGGRRFPIGHAATGGRVPLILAARDEELDEPTERYGDDHRRRSPFLLAQEYLNAGAALWAIVSNGRVLRVLRDNPSLTRPAYLEFDLERLFEERLYPDFAVLWLACHASRFGAASAAPSDCALERWKSVAQQEGTRARERLRFGVADALRELGTGFLAASGNTALRERIEKGELSSEGFYQQLLRLVYRFLFLFTVEERGLIHPPTASKEAIELYRDGYSLAQLRALAAKRRRFDRHYDLWQALCITFAGLGKGQPALGLPGLGGLFRFTECPDVDAADLPNRSLLQAIYKLAYFIEDGALVRVNYRDMGSQELGSIYEALLELVPEIDTASHPWRFRFIGDDAPAGDAVVAGNARKLSGSYYTPDTLVQELIKSALEPVIAERLKRAEDPERTLLSIKVLDPACGSGHFLLAAARKLAEQLARIRSNGNEPKPEDYRRALRDVVTHCICGVDRNPLALELARTALWLESFSPDRPLGFLDHHLRCGDALIGVLDPKVLENGVPDAAFKPLSGDDKSASRALVARNVAARRTLVREKERLALMQELTVYETEGGRVLEEMPEENVEQVEEKRVAFERAHVAAELSKAQRIADCFVAAFYMPKTKDGAEAVPTTEDFHRILRDVSPRAGVADATRNAARAAQAFHWRQEFAEVFARGGFDVLLGNPPWERMKLQEEEFFAARSKDIATARHKSDRTNLIEKLREGTALEVALYQSFITAKRDTEAASAYAHESGRFPLCGVGDVNTYALFAETFSQLLRPDGRAGFVVPTGIATDDTTKEFFRHLIDREMLVSLLDFRTGPGLFPDVGHQRFKFCLLTIGRARLAHFVFFALEVAHLTDERRHFTLSLDDFRLINPNTRTCPVFRSQRDAELTKRVYRAVPVFVRDPEKDASGKVLEIGRNSWDVRFQTMFHMSNDSNLFKRVRGQDDLPLYEAKMVHQFDHRWATYEDGADDPRDCTEAEKVQRSFVAKPQYWVERRQVLGRIARVPRKLATAWVDADEEAVLIALAVWLSFQLQAADRSAEIRTIQPLLAQALTRAKDEGVVVKDASEYRLTDEEIALLHPCTNASEILTVVDELMDSRSPKWLMGWRDITNATNERTVIASVVPRSGIGNSMPTMLFDRAQHGPRCAALLANLNSMTLDYVARHKAGGVHLNFFIFKQLPILAPDRYSEADLEFIVPRVLELTYTSMDLTPWASDLGYVGPPFGWESGRRAMLRAELDAYFARLYGLNRNDLRFVLDPQEVEGSDYPSRTFHRLKENEVRAFGEYRTRRLVLDAWDRLERGDRVAARDVAELPLQPLQSTDSLASEVWARPMADERAESGAVLGAILKAMAGAMPAREVRLTATLALQPRLLHPFLTADEAITWRRLIGPEADALPQGTSTVIPKVDGAWGAAVRTLRTNGSLIEETGSATWAPGANLDALETAGWPDGRARFVLAVLERQSTESIVPELPASFRDWIDAKAA